MALVKAILSKQLFRAYLNTDQYLRLCSTARDVIKVNNAQIQSDILINSLRNVRTVNTVLELVNVHDKSMNHKHLLQALRIVFNLQKGGNSDLSTNQIVKNPHFDRLCRSLKRHAGALEANEAIESLKVLSFLGVPADSTIMQALLQLIRHKVNDLSLQQMIFLEFLLSQFKSTPLVEALRIAIPLVFEIQLPYKVDRDNMQSLCDNFQYASKAKVSAKCIEFINTALLQCSAPFDAKIASSIAWSICDLEADVFFEPLLLKALDCLVLNVYTMRFEDMETTLSKLSKNFSMKTPFYYHEIFFDICASMVIDKDLGFHYAVYVLRKFFKIGHLNMNLLNYVSLKALEEPQLKFDPIFFNDVAVAMTMTDTRPAHWEHLAELLETMPLPSAGNQGDIMWLKIAVSLVSLGIYREDILQNALNEAYLRKLFKRNFQFDFDQLLHLNQAISTYKPELERLLPAPEFLKATMSKLKSFQGFPLESSLKYAFGGDQFVATELLSRLGHKIDHVVAFDSDGRVLPIKNYIANNNSNMHFIEDVKLPPNSKIIPVIAMTWVNYAINCQRHRALASLMLRTFKARGYNVVPINLEAWYGLQDFEKIPFLKQAIENAKDNSRYSYVDSIE